MCFYAAQERVPTAYLALIERVCDCNADYSIRMVDNNKDKKTIDLDISSPSFRDLVIETASSTNALQVEVIYHLRSGNEVGLNFILNGTNYRRGIWWAVSGPVECEFDYSDISKIVHAPKLINLPFGRSCHFIDVVPRDDATVFSDSAALFLHCSGVMDNRLLPDAFDSSLIYSSEWTPGPGCAMRFHKDATGFSHDFPRMFAAYHWKLATSDLNNTTGPVSEYKKLARNPYVNATKDWCDPREAEACLEGFHHDFARELRFYASLSEAKVDAICALPKSTISEQLLEYSCMDHQILYDEFCGGSAALMTLPQKTLLSAYEYIYSINTKDCQ